MSRLTRELERRIVKQVVDDLLAAGFTLWIDRDGEDERIEVKNSYGETLDELFACDEERLYAYRSPVEGWVYFVYGSNGYDVVSDYTTNLQEWMESAIKIADEYY